MRYVYIAGPITKGSPFTNVKKGIEEGNALLDHGFIPYIPHLTALWAMVTGDKTFEEWLAYDERWLLKCDCILRLDGESPGADREVQFAKENGIPVYYCLSDLYAARKLWVSQNTSITGDVPAVEHSRHSISQNAPSAEKLETKTT